ncbi:MAG: D-tyrosyl-tRNA(Tyr) deacylase [Treponema sp.]|jgi:D-tyrosyl-tRNA(Tyr) deacylase|nr:D-tyrosyl-tRNA(Tyr) deacylase [Treponema sp.]
MKAVVQRIIDASVTVNGHNKGSVESGLLVYLGVAQGDSKKDADWLADKIVNLRIFNDEGGVMNLSLKDVIAGKEERTGILVISQFTLLADARKGRRPSWSGAAQPEAAKELYEYFIIKIREQGILCEHGEFQANMKVTATNDGPVTILLDTKF